MRYTLDEILRMTGDLVRANNITDDLYHEYDWIQQAWIPPQPSELAMSLYFASYMKGRDGWHNPFDRRTTIRETLSQRPGWHGVVEPQDPPLDAQHLVVSSFKDFSRRLYWNARSRTKPFVIGVTGSVGKTTSVAFLEHLLRCAGLRVVRFWSKRLTPLLIETHYVNRVFPDTEVVVLEYSAFRRLHVDRLAQHLPPDLSFFINLYSQHIHPDLFQDKSEVFESKIKIKPDRRIGFINETIVRDMRGAVPEHWRVFSADSQFLGTNPRLPPTQRTGELHAVGRLVAEHLAISEGCVRDAFASFVPQEGRLVTCQFSCGSVFFDSEAPHGPRLWSWFETIDGSVPTLLIESIAFGHDDTATYLDLLVKIFDSAETYVLDTRENRKNIPVDAHFVSRDTFRSLLLERMGARAYVVYHMTEKGTIKGFVHRDHLEATWHLDEDGVGLD